jgi:chemotaxis protein histidine kinase CheA
LLAGRGIGLDIARSGIQRLGGAIHLSSRVREGFSARVDLPVESGVTSVLWVRAAGEEYAIPVASSVRVVKLDAEGEPPRVAHLAACLEGRPSAGDRPMFAVAFDLEDPRDATPLAIGVDAVGAMEELLVRPLSPLVAGLGPYAGAIARGDGSLRLALDMHALAPRARAILRGAVRSSDAPDSSTPSSRARRGES